MYHYKNMLEGTEYEWYHYKAEYYKKNPLWEFELKLFDSWRPKDIFLSAGRELLVKSIDDF